MLWLDVREPQGVLDVPDQRSPGKALKSAQSVLVQDSDCIVCLHSKAELEHYIILDKQYFWNLKARAD
jgi:hypothetical protein